MAVLLFNALLLFLNFFQDHLLLSHSVQLFSDKSMEPDQFQRLLLVFLAIARARPHHLNLIDTDLTNTLNSVLKLEGAIDLKPSESVVKRQGDREEIVRAKEGRSVSEPVGSVSTSMFVDKLNQLFWKYYKQRPKSVAVAPVCGVGECYCPVFMHSSVRTVVRLW